MSLGFVAPEGKAAEERTSSSPVPSKSLLTLIWGEGEKIVEQLAIPSGQDVSQAFAPDATVELPGGATASVAEFLEGCTQLEARDLLSSGHTVSGLASLEWGARMRDAAFVAELDPAGTQVLRLRWFWEG